MGSLVLLGLGVGLYPIYLRARLVQARADKPAQVQPWEKDVHAPPSPRKPRTGATLAVRKTRC